MTTDICLGISLAFLLAGFAGAFILYKMPYKRGRLLSPANWLPAAVFLSALALFFPIYGQQFGPGPVNLLKTLLISVHTVIRLFVLDGDFVIIDEFTAGLAPAMADAFSATAAIVYVLGPILTFGFILSFFKNVTAYRDLLLSFRSDLYVFSELNERSLALASSIREGSRRSTIVFTEVFDQEEENALELREMAKELKAICFRKDIVDINWDLHRDSRNVYLFAIGENEAENIEQSVKLVDHYGSKQNFRLFIFASGAESEMLFSAISGDGMRVRRINPVRSLIDHSLYHTGGEIFRHAADDGNPEKLISAVLIGMGQHGTEMLKALTWMCQMDGYRLEINAFDKDPLALEKLTLQCPELMAPERNGTREEGEAHYHIAVHPGVDVSTMDFQRKIQAIDRITYVFVALGNDSRNTQTAITMRMLSERKGIHPYIQSILYSTSKKKILETVTDYRGHSYDIHFIGDLRSSYCTENIVDSQLYQVALQRHLKWGDEREFWAYEFNFHSSIAAAIHLEMRKVCGMPWAGKKESELTDQERDALERLEHRRWNAYMRSEGYIYSGSIEKSSRNDLAKLHNNLVPYDELPNKIKHVDSIVGSE
ncbi:MAG: hypothetical protein J6C98_09975 [Oscillospiraceae bacterium]|nr:hypothetical protein [Oscillospiraceae bacterium]